MTTSEMLDYVPTLAQERDHQRTTFANLMLTKDFQKGEPLFGSILKVTKLTVLFVFKNAVKQYLDYLGIRHVGEDMAISSFFKSILTWDQNEKNVQYILPPKELFTGQLSVFN